MKVLICNLFGTDGCKKCCNCEELFTVVGNIKQANEIEIINELYACQDFNVEDGYCVWGVYLNHSSKRDWVVYGCAEGIGESEYYYADLSEAKKKYNELIRYCANL